MSWKRFLAFFLALALVLGAAPLANAGGSVEMVGSIKQAKLSADDYYFFADAAKELRDASDLQVNFSYITLRIGSGVMMVDGKHPVAVSAPVRSGNDVLLPAAAVAEAVGASVEVNEQTGAITITEEGIANVLSAHAEKANQSIASASQTYVLDDGSVTLIGEDFRTEQYKALYSVSELVNILSLEMYVSGDVIILSKDCQLGQLLVQTQNRKAPANTYGAAEIRTNGNGLYVLQYEAPSQAKAALAALKRDKNISLVEPNRIRTTMGYEVQGGFDTIDFGTERWSTSRVSADMMKAVLEAEGKTDAELIVAVIDSGLQVSHPDFEGRTVAGKSFTTPSVMDNFGHGTHVAGTIVDCTPDNVKVMPLKVIIEDAYEGTVGGMAESDIAAAVAYAAANNAKVINMSLGGPDDGVEGLLFNACQSAVNSGVIVCVASGNDGLDILNTNIIDDDGTPYPFIGPAYYDFVITVGAVDINDQIADFSNYGGSIDVVAPGVNIWSSVPTDSYAYYDGTSMASPHVAAAAAMLKLQDSSRDPKEVKRLLRATSVDMRQTGWDQYYGAGIVDFRIHLNQTVNPTALGLDSYELYLGLTAGCDTLPFVPVFTPFNATNKGVNITVNDTGIVEYSDSGRLVAKGAGEAIVTVTSDANPGLVVECVVHVLPSNYWSDFPGGGFAGGTGTVGDPFLISNESQLAYFADQMINQKNQFENQYIKLTEDLDLSYQNRKWLPLATVEDGIPGPFLGHFDGDYHIISNMTGAPMELLYGDLNGFFGHIALGSVTRLGLTDAVVICNDVQVDYAGILVALSEDAYISECFTTGDTNYAAFAGDVYGGLIENCYSTGSGIWSAFLFQMNGTTVRNCYASGVLNNGGEYAAGFALIATSGDIYNSFSASNPGMTGFASFRYMSNFYSCYYSNSNTMPIAFDYGNAYGAVTMPYGKAESAFRAKAFYTKEENWQSGYPWDFTNTWTIHSEVNDGLPTLAGFGLSEPEVGSKVTPMVVSGSSFTVALDSAGQVWTWGLSSSGQLGQGADDYASHSTPEKVEGLAKIVFISAGRAFVIAIDENGDLWGWGANNAKQIANITANPVSTPMKIDGIQNVVSVATGDSHTLALTEDGRLYAWGNNYNGQLGNGNKTNQSVPVEITDRIDGVIVGIYANSYQSYAVTEDGKLYAWGWGSSNRLGLGDTADKTVPTLSSLQGVTTVSVGNQYGMALANGERYAWGSNEYGQFGNGTRTDEATPALMESPDNVVAISGWNNHSAVIDVDGALWTFGQNQSGAIGNGTNDPYGLFPVTTPYAVGLEGKVVYASTGSANTFAITEDGKLYAWGTNSFGELGDSSTVNRFSPVFIMELDVEEDYEEPEEPEEPIIPDDPDEPGIPGNDGEPYTFTMVSAAGLFTAALDEDGHVWVWGSNEYGQLGNGTYQFGSKVSEPHMVPDLSDIVYISAGGGNTTGAGSGHIMAIDKNGDLWGWGANEYNQINNSSPINRVPSPVKIGGISNVKLVSAGSLHTLAVTEDGTLYAWGDNFRYQLGDGTRDRSQAPINLSGNFPERTIVYISAGRFSSMAVTNYGEIYTWGLGDNGRLGHGSTGAKTVPTYISTFDEETRFDAVQAATEHGLALTDSGALYAWGSNQYGQYGNGTKGIGSYSPEAITTLDGIKEIASTYTHSAAIDSDGQLWLFGSNTRGEIGNGVYDRYDTNPVTTPFNVPMDEEIVSVSVGWNNTFALTESGKLYAWGSNEYGQIGDGTTEDRNVPTIVALPGSGTVDEPFDPGEPGDAGDVEPMIVMGDEFTLLLKDDGSLWGFGNNSEGQLGQDTETAYFTEPVLIMNQVSYVAAGSKYAMAIRYDGTLWSWGKNFLGSVGKGELGEIVTPVQILTDVVDISAGRMHSLAVQSDGSFWAWGDNSFEQLGASQASAGSYRRIPVKIIESGVQAVAAGYTHSLILMDDGTLYACGSNDYGQVGNGTAVQVARPVKIMTDVAYIAAGGIATDEFGGGGTSYAVKQDGTLWAWGYNYFGQLGIGHTSPEQTPQYVMDDVLRVYAGAAHAAAIKVDGSFYTWGYGEEGQLLNGRINHREMPEQITADGVDRVFAAGLGWTDTLVINADGEVWAAGFNAYGQLGDGTTTRTYTPKMIMSGLVIPQYEITVNYAYNGTVAPLESNTFNYLEEVTLQAIPNNGYYFAGWYEGGILISTANPYSFYAHRDMSITPSFIYGIAPPVIDVQPQSQTVFVGAPVSLSVTVSADIEQTIYYRWYSKTSKTAEAKNYIADANTATYVPSTDSTGMYYYGVEVWTEKNYIWSATVYSDVATVIVLPAITYTLSYDANGGTGTAPEELSIVGGGTFIAEVGDIFSMTGKRLARWNTKADGTGTSYQPGDTAIMPYNNLVLYAIWEDASATQYFVTYSDGGEWGYTDIAKHGEYTLLSIEQCGFAVPTGQEFAGWKVGDDDTLRAAGDVITITGDITITAQWRAIEKVPVKIAVSASALTTLARGQSMNVTATILPADSFAAMVTWQASNGNMVSLTPSADGRSVAIKGMATGTVVITCTVTTIFGDTVSTSFVVRVV